MNISLTPAWVRGNHVIRTFDGETPGIEPATSMATVGLARLPDDPIGAFSLVLTNLVIGSSIRIETATGELVDFRVATASTETLPLAAYAPGNSRNSLRIKVRKSTSAPKYKPLLSMVTAIVGVREVFIAQQPAPIA